MPTPIRSNTAGNIRHSGTRIRLTPKPVPGIIRPRPLPATYAAP